MTWTTIVGLAILVLWWKLDGRDNVAAWVRKTAEPEKPKPPQEHPRSPFPL